MSNLGMTERKKYLMDKLEANTINFAESQEFSNILKVEEKEARRINNRDALVAILGMQALLATLTKY